MQHEDLYIKMYPTPVIPQGRGGLPLWVLCPLGNELNNYVHTIKEKQMKSRLFALLIGLLTMYTINAQQVVLYSDCGFRGQSIALNPGNYLASQHRMRVRDLSSIQIPAGLAVNMFSADFFNGQYVTLTQSSECLINQNFNDEMVSIQIYRSGNILQANQSPVTIYERCNFGGRSEPLNEGSYTQLNMGFIRAQSIRVAAGYGVIFQKEIRQGMNVSLTNEEYRADKSCLTLLWGANVKSAYVYKLGNIYENTWNTNQGMINSFNQGAVVFEHGNYGGRAQIMNPGAYRGYQLDQVGGERVISSIKVSPGYRVIAFSGSNFDGSSITFTSSNVNLAQTTINWNDRISSLIVERTGSGSVIINPTYPNNNVGTSPSSLPQNAVTVFSAPNLSGAKWSAPIGSYRSNQILFVGPGTIQSIHIPYGYRLVMYQGTGMNGVSGVLNAGTYYNLASDAPSWNRNINSMRVESIDQGSVIVNPTYPNTNNPTNPASLPQDAVTLFSEQGLSGAKWSAPVGSYRSNQILYIGPGTAQSMYIPSGFRLVAYQGPNFNGSSNIFPRGIYYNLATDAVGWGRAINSMVVERDINNTINQGNVNVGAVVAYTDAGYRGSSASFQMGSHNTQQLGGAFVRTISSIQIPSGYRVVVYDGPNFTGNYRILTYSIDNFAAEGNGQWNDRIQSMVVESANSNTTIINNNNNIPGRPQPTIVNSDIVMAYADVMYQGSVQPLAVGSYTGNQLIGTPPRTLSSIKIPPGYKVTVYDGPNFNGDYRVLTYSIDNFAAEGNGQWNDRVSSIIVERTNF